MLVIKQYSLHLPDSDQFILKLALDTRRHRWSGPMLFDSEHAPKLWLGTVDTNAKKFNVKRRAEASLRSTPSAITIRGYVDAKNRMSIAFGIAYDVLLWNLLLLLFVSWFGTSFGLIGILVAVCSWVLAGSLAVLDFNNSYNQFVQYLPEGTAVVDEGVEDSVKRYLK